MVILWVIVSSTNMVSSGIASFRAVHRYVASIGPLPLHQQTHSGSYIALQVLVGVQGLINHVVLVGNFVNNHDGPGLGSCRRRVPGNLGADQQEHVAFGQELSGIPSHVEGMVLGEVGKDRGAGFDHRDCQQLCQFQ